VDDVVAVVPDLFFQSRISATARIANRNVRYVSPTSLDEIHGFQLALIDLDATEAIAPVIEQVRARGEGTIVAFGPHVDTDRRKAARAAGADRVLAKSKFVTDLPRILGVERSA
jgi:hypothetical protein